MKNKGEDKREHEHEDEHDEEAETKGPGLRGGIRGRFRGPERIFLSPNLVSNGSNRLQEVLQRRRLCL